MPTTRPAPHSCPVPLHHTNHPIACLPSPRSPPVQTIKPIYGFLSDAVPLFGYRRRSYLVLCGLLGEWLVGWRVGLGWVGWGEARRGGAGWPSWRWLHYL